ncbi:MAG: DUF4340 domain-containing protein [Lysobacteraceae bacterium]
MNSRHLLILAAAALLAAIVAYWTLGARAPQQDVAVQGALLPGLSERLNDIDRVQLRAAGNTVLATLERDDDGWSLAERGGYPADAGKLRSLLLGLAQANRVEAKTANPALHARLGVEDIAAADAHGIEVELSGGGDPLRLIIGENNTRAAGTYVRLGGEAQSWLLDRNLAVERNPVEWLQRELVAIPTSRIESVTVTPADSAPIRIVRGEGAGADFRLADLPRGREPASEFVADATASLLDGLRFDDVFVDDGAERDGLRVARFDTVEGLTLNLHAWQDEGRTLARFRIELDEDKAAQWAATQTEADDADDEAEADDADAAPNAATRLEALRAELARLEARFAGRVFALPAFKAGNLDRDLDAYLKPKD